MAARVFCIASAKGGSGKTVLTAGFGHFLAALGKKVLLIDTDAATNGLSLLYLNEVVHHRDEIFPNRQKERRFEEHLIPGGIFDSGEEIIPSSTELATNLKLLPATYRFNNTEKVPTPAYEQSLHKALRAARAKYDYIFLDAQAGADNLAQVSMQKMVSDAVVIVSEYDPLSAGGVERLKSLFPESLTYDRTWILLNKVLPEFSTSLGEFLQVARYLSPIPWNADVVRAYAQRTLALDLDHGNDYTLAVTQTVKGLVGPGIAKEVEGWIESRAAALREPIEIQIHDLEVEAEGLVIERAKLERSLNRRRLFLAAGASYFALGLILVLIWLTSNSTLPSAVVPAALFAAITGVAAMWRGGASSIDTQVEDSRLRRREMILEERLQRLSALSDASPEDLLKSR